LHQENFKPKIQKSVHESEYLSHITRKYSFWITRICIRLNIHSNTITGISLFFAIVGAICQSSTELNYINISILFMLIYNIFDHVDGELARYEKKFHNEQKGLDGPYFDALVHYFFTPLLFFSIGLAAYHTNGNEMSLWCGLLVGMWLSSYGHSSSYRVLMDYIFHADHNTETLKIIEPIWKHNKTQKGSITYKEHFIYILRECFNTQGVIYILTGLHLINILFPMLFQLRFYYLYLMGLIAIFNMPRVCFKYFKLLKKIK
jgi:hypothetical protein